MDIVPFLNESHKDLIIVIQVHSQNNIHVDHNVTSFYIRKIKEHDKKD